MLIDPALPIGRKLKLARIARGVRQRDLALSIDMPPATLSALENDYRPPRDAELAAILRILGLERRDLDGAAA